MIWFFISDVHVSLNTQEKTVNLSIFHVFHRHAKTVAHAVNLQCHHMLVIVLLVSINH